MPMPEHELKESNRPMSILFREFSPDKHFDYDRIQIAREDIKEAGEMLDQIFSDNGVALGDLETFRRELAEVPQDLMDTPEYNFWHGVFRGRLYAYENGEV